MNDPLSRVEAWALAEALADAKFSVSADIGVHPKMFPSETCTVSVRALSPSPEQLRSLASIGEEHRAGLHFIGNGALTFFGTGKREEADTK